MSDAGDWGRKSVSNGPRRARGYSLELFALLCASLGVLQLACARESHQALPAPAPAALPSATHVTPAARNAAPPAGSVARQPESPPDSPSREWPECTRPTSPKLEAWPLLDFRRASKHELSGDHARFNVRATLSAVERTDPCAESSEYWWPAQKCAGESFVTLSLTGAAPSPTLNALAALSFWGGSLDVGREYEFSLGFCRGTSGAPVAQVFGYEAVGRAAGGDPRECQAQTHDNWPYRPIESLRVNDVLPGGFRTTGFVIQCFEPAPCPPRALCKPQPAPYILLAANLAPRAATLRLDETCGKRFKVGNRYDVAVVLESTNTMGLTNLGHPCPALVPR